MTAGALLVGWDGATWDLLDPMIESGRLPHLAGLVQRGKGRAKAGSVFEIIERDLTRTFPRHAMFETAVIDGGRSDPRTPAAA